MLDCVVYVSSVANVKKHTRKTQCLESFATGVASSGGRVRVEHDYVYTPSRLAVMLGWATTNTGGRNITLRKEIIAEQRRRGLQTMCIDASCWKYIDEGSRYLRYSLNGPFYDRAEYANLNSDSAKWNEIRQALHIELKSPQLNPQGHVLICMQRDGGFAMKTLSPLAWLEQKITEIRQYTTRSIVVRPHPGAYKMQDFAKFTNVTVIDPAQTELVDNLTGAHSVVLFNSSASVAAVCAGIPVFADDSSCVSWAVANKSVSRIEFPEQFDRQQWIQDLSAAHWSDDDARQGRIYQKFLPYLTSTVTS